MLNMTTQQILNQKQKERRYNNGNLYTKRYEKTTSGFLMRSYRNMQSRVTGVQWKKAHLYKGLSILPRESFYDWSKKNKDFWTLFEEWEINDYDRKLTPSINRIDSSIGYELNNMEWITHSENSRLGHLSRYSKDTDGSQK